MTAAARALLAGLSVARLLQGADAAAGRFAPTYASSSLVHAASQINGSFAPNTIVTLYGKDLAYVTRALQAGDIHDSLLPTIFAGTGVRAYIDNVPVPLYFVSPGQINLLIPATLKPGRRKLQTFLDGQSGPVLDLELAAAAPGLFLQQPALAIAVRVDGSLVNDAAPARPGEVVVLYATGLGEVAGRPMQAGEIAKQAAWLAAMDAFAIRLNGAAVPRDHILYAGLAPGFAGLYQINLRLPADTPGDPEIRVEASAIESPAGVRIAMRR